MATRKTRKIEPKFISQMAADDYAFALATRLGYVIDDSETTDRTIAYTTEDGETFEVFVTADGKSLAHRWLRTNEQPSY
jgi:hypothetical protein